MAKLMFEEGGDLTYLDDGGNIIFRPDGDENIVLCLHQNVAAFISFLSDEAIKFDVSQGAEPREVKP